MSDAHVSSWCLISNRYRRPAVDRCERAPLAEAAAKILHPFFSFIDYVRVPTDLLGMKVSVPVLRNTAPPSYLSGRETKSICLFFFFVFFLFSWSSSRKERKKIVYLSNDFLLAFDGASSSSTSSCHIADNDEVDLSLYKERKWSAVGEDPPNLINDFPPIF